MSWTILILKALCFAVPSVLLVLIFGMRLLPTNGAKAIGVDLFLHWNGELLLLSGLLQVVIGFLLLRLNVFFDGGRLHFTLMR